MDITKSSFKSVSRWNTKLRLRNILIFWRHGTAGTQAKSQSKHLQRLKRTCETAFKMHQRTGKSVRNTEGSNKVKQRLEYGEQVKLWGWASKPSAGQSKQGFPLPPKGRGLMGVPSRIKLGPQRVTSQWGKKKKKRLHRKLSIWNLGIKWEEGKIPRWPPNRWEPKFTHHND